MGAFTDHLDRETAELRQQMLRDVDEQMNSEMKGLANIVGTVKYSRPREARGLLQRRPAESASASLGIAGIVYGISEGNVPAAICAGAGLVPGLVTLLIANGGLRGCLRLLWSGS